MKKTVYKYLIILVVFSWQSVSWGQNIQVEYLVQTNKNNDISSTSIKYNLILKSNQSAYYNNHDDLSQFKYQDFIVNTEKIGELTLVKLDDNHYSYLKQDMFYKDYTQDTLIYNEIVGKHKVIIGESTSKLFDWKITPDSDTIILNYKCQKAEAKFRGREYIAYFSSDLAEFGGPWKFDGLPGLILYVHSKDKYYVLTPVKLTLNKETDDLANPYAKQEKIITWDKYIHYTKKLFEKQLKYFRSISDPGDELSIKVTDKIEDLGIEEMSFKK